MEVCACMYYSVSQDLPRLPLHGLSVLEISLMDYLQIHCIFLYILFIWSYRVNMLFFQSRQSTRFALNIWQLFYTELSVNKSCSNSMSHNGLNVLKCKLWALNTAQINFYVFLWQLFWKLHVKCLHEENIITNWYWHFRANLLVH